MTIKQIKILKSLGAYITGQIVRVEVDSNGVPLSRFWRRRLKDSAKDGFCQFVEEKESKAEPRSEKKPRNDSPAED